MQLSFEELCTKYQKHNADYVIADRLLALDPGYTTGYALFDRYNLIDAGQWSTDVDNYKQCVMLLNKFTPLDTIIIEDYKIYRNKVDIHSNKPLWIPNMIGAIEMFAQMQYISVYKQMAREVKPFCTDDKLKQWKFYQRGKKHANDAVRHAAYWLIFKGKDKK